MGKYSASLPPRLEDFLDRLAQSAPTTATVLVIDPLMVLLVDDPAPREREPGPGEYRCADCRKIFAILFTDDGQADLQIPEGAQLEQGDLICDDCYTKALGLEEETESE